MMEEKFNFTIPMDVVKASKDDDGEWRIGGYASTADPDRQGDTIIQRGLDYSDFVNYGFFNYDHHNDQVLGYPDKRKCYVNNKGFYVEGTLLKDIPLAKKVWDTALALKNAGAPRKLGFSVEGKVLAKNPQGKITKAKIYNVAITANPVNTNCTWDALVKSFDTSPEPISDELEKSIFNDDPVDSVKTVSYIHIPNDMKKDMGIERECLPFKIETYIPKEEFMKALTTGNYSSAGSVSDKTGGAAITPESIDNAIKVLSSALEGDGEDMINKILDALSKRSLKKSELTLYMMLSKGLSLKESKELVEKLI